jgi:hypothetical protein
MRYLIFIILIGLCISCSEVFLGKDVRSTPQENFESLWTILDQKYSFFSYKNVDWNEMHAKYAPKIKESTSDLELFSTLFQMLSELRDAHVNLVSPFNVSRYEGVFISGPENFNYRLIQDSYLGSDYFITGPFKHQLIANGKVGYVRYADFESIISKSDMDFIIEKYKTQLGLIIDVRSNGGGYISNVFTLCRTFADQNRLVYTSYIKTGPGHEDFSQPDNVYISPQSATPYTKPVCVLTNRGCYSATSFFILAMKAFPNVTTVGDTTGGGLGAPTGAELPNGWSFRFSCTRTLSPDGKNYEDGIPPDHMKYLKTSDVAKGYDSIIEEAVKIILSK